MYYVYTLRNGDNYFYVGSTRNLQDRKRRHFSKTDRRTKESISNESIFEIDSEFATKLEAELHEMVLACALIAFEYHLKIRRVGKKRHKKLMPTYTDSYKRPHKEETKKKISSIKKETYANSNAKMFLEESNRMRSRKIMIDGIVYPSKREAARTTGMDRKMMDYWIKKGSDRVCYV